MRVESITVGPDRVDVVVSLGPDESVRAVPGDGIAKRALDLLPALASHQCLNDDGRPFAEELAATEIPHLFEHVVLELMAQAGSPRRLRGETAWNYRRDGRGVFRISFEYDDDLVCIGAVKAAYRLMDHLLGDAAAPDVGAEVARLRSLRSAPAPGGAV